MKRNQFCNFITQGNKRNHVLAVNNVVGESVTDPSYAQSGRQMIANPLPIQPRVQYSSAAPLNKENPFEVKEYDKLYPDKFKASKQAQEDINAAKNGLDKIQEKVLEDARKVNNNNNPQN